MKKFPTTISVFAKAVLRYLAAVIAFICFLAITAWSTNSAKAEESRSPDLMHAYLVMKKPFTKEACAQHAYDLIKSAVGDIATKEDRGASASDDKFTVAIECAPPKTVFFIGAAPPNDSDGLEQGLQKLMKDFQGPNCNSCTEKK
jgi:hypothetical protein